MHFMIQRSSLFVIIYLGVFLSRLNEVLSYLFVSEASKQDNQNDQNSCELWPFVKE